MWNMGSLIMKNSNKCWVNTLLFSLFPFISFSTPWHSSTPHPTLLHGISAKFTFGHHLPLITVPLCRNIFSSCKLNCPSGAISHLMKMTPWHRTCGSLYDSFGILSLFKLWTHFAALRIRSAWFARMGTFWPAFGWTLPCTHESPKNKNIQAKQYKYFFWKWIKPTGWFKVLQYLYSKCITYIGFLDINYTQFIWIENGINDYKSSMQLKRNSFTPWNRQSSL